jgi:hypothetical protein
MIRGQSLVDGQQQSIQRTEKGIIINNNTKTAANAYIGAFFSSLPIEARDMLIGAASGTAAALASMPFDVTFTRMNLGTQMLSTAAAGSSGGSVRHSLANFAATVRLIIAQGGGPHSLFTGVVPRLLQTVPAGMVYWAAVEATRRALENRYEIEKPKDESLVEKGSSFCMVSARRSHEDASSALGSRDDEVVFQGRQSNSSFLSTAVPASVPVSVPVPVQAGMARP